MTQNNKESAQETIHLIGNAHIDPVWLWRWTDGFSEVKATFQAALDRLQEYPDFVFTCAGACYYRWVEENCPAMFEEIRHYVAEGRWVPVNGWWLQPDCNIPCGESFARHGLYGQRFFLDRFGMICDTGYNVDSFGHSGMLPQILKKSGMNHYVFMRPSDTEKPGVPHVFNWRSRDGSQVLTFKIPLGYGQADAEKMPEKVKGIAEVARREAKDMMLFYGVGNHGGGPTIAVLNKIKSLQSLPGGDRLVFSSPPQYMAAVSRQADPLPVVTEDLQYHAIGCYSAMLAVKQLNRRAEQRLLAAERFDTLAHQLFQTPLHTADLGKAWEKVLFNQFHDILAGCSIKTAYDDAGESYGYALSSAAEVLNSAVQKIAWAVDTLGPDRLPRSKDEDWQYWGLGAKGSPAVVFNPLPYPVEAPVEFSGAFAAITDADGSPLAVQQVRSLVTNGENDKWNTLAIASLPALGYATFWLHKKAADAPADMSADAAPADTSATAAQPGKLELAADGSRLANALTEVLIDPQAGRITGIIDRQSGRSYLQGPCVSLVIDETHSDTWGHGLKEYRDVVGSFAGETVQALDRGPIRGLVRLFSRYGDSTMIQDVILYADRPEIEIRLKIHWREKHKMLKLEFPLQTGQAIATAEIPYGFIERPMDGFEKPIQQWADISDDQGGVSVINDSSYALDIKDGVLRQTVLRSPIYADHFGRRDDGCEFMEQGEHEVKYLIYPHAGDWRAAATARKALAFNCPPVKVNETYHHGPLPQVMTGLAIQPANIVAVVLKGAENGRGAILRCQETDGQGTTARISMPLADRQWEAAFGPCEIKTFLIPDDAAEAVSEVNLLEMPAG